MNLRCEGMLKGDDHPLTAAFADIAREWGIEFVVCITRGRAPLTPDGAEMRAQFIDGRDDETDTAYAGGAMWVGGEYLMAAAEAVADYLEAQETKDARIIMGLQSPTDANGSPA